MEVTNIIQILLSTLITIVTAITIYHNRKIEWLERDKVKIMVDIERIKTDKSVEYGQLEVKLEQMKSLIRDELHQARESITNEIHCMRENMIENFVQKERK